MYGTYLRFDITVHDGWRAVVRAAAASSPGKRCATGSAGPHVRDSTAG